MKIITVFFLLLLSIQGWAQSLPVVKDADGKVIGYPIGMDSYLDTYIVIRPDEIVVEVWASDGDIDGSAWYPKFQSTDCSGPALTEFSYFESVVNNLITDGWGKEPPRPVVLVSKGLTPQEYTINSSISPMGCGTWTEPQTGQYVSHDDIKIEDPSQYGFMLLPEINEWGYKGPLTLGLIKSDLISCNGFESCPTN